MITVEYLRQFKLGPFALFDIVVSYIGIAILSPLLSWIFSKVGFKIPLITWIWWTMPLSVLFHILFQQSTPLMKMLSKPNTIQFYIALLILLGMTYMGWRKIVKMGE